MGNYLWRWIKGATSPSESRWGIIAFMVAISFLLCEISGMLDLFFASYPVWQRIVFFAGAVIFALAFVLGTLWLSAWRQYKGEPKDIGDINKSIRNYMQKTSRRKRK